MINSLKDKIAWDNQNNIRVSNQIAVVEALKEGPKSCSELANSLGLSNTAIKKIVVELLNNKLISYDRSKDDTAPSKKKGRKPIPFCLNKNKGLVAAIDLSGRDMSLCLANLGNEILVRSFVKDVLYIDEKVLLRIVDCLRDMLNDKKVKGMSLLTICISSPGKIDKATGGYFYAPRIIDYKNINLPKFFSKYFNVDTYVYKDTNLGCVGEKRFGVIPNDAKNVYFAFVDITSGSSLIIDGKLYEGSNGFAGELSDYRPVDGPSKESRNGKFYTITEIFADIIQRSKTHPEHPLYGKEVLHLQDVVDLYNKRDSLVTAAVNLSAKYNAIEMLAVTNLLDLDYIVIEGRILEFGETYEQLLIKDYNEYDANHNSAKILFSSLNYEANLLGAAYQGTTMFFLKRFEEMAMERTNSRNYNARKYFENKM
jgi:predicted NBD/HSP70 family sugar kinase